MTDHEVKIFVYRDSSLDSVVLASKEKIEQIRRISDQEECLSGTKQIIGADSIFVHYDKAQVATFSLQEVPSLSPLHMQGYQCIQKDNDKKIFSYLYQFTEDKYSGR